MILWIQNKIEMIQMLVPLKLSRVSNSTMQPPAKYRATLPSVHEKLLQRPAFALTCTTGLKMTGRKSRIHTQLMHDIGRDPHSRSIRHAGQPLPRGPTPGAERTSRARTPQLATRLAGFVHRDGDFARPSAP
jgi:hypothetical protein